MPRIVRLLIGLYLAILLNPSLSPAQVSTVGKEFWFGFMENNRVNSTNPNNSAPDVGIVIITANEATDGILQYNNRVINFQLSEGQQFIHRIEDFDILHRTTGVIENKGVYVKTSGKVAVHAFNERFRSADGTVILPLATLGKDYYVTAHFEDMFNNNGTIANNGNESTMLVVAVEENTRVEITPSVTTIDGKVAGSSFTIDLNAGQTYQLKAWADLTGTRVRVVGATGDDCKNIAVFGGNKWSRVGMCGSANDHLFQQMYSVNTWSTEYLPVPFLGRTSGELVKVLAAENGTEIFVDGSSRGVLNAGQSISLNFAANTPGRITSSKPSSVTVFSKSQQCNVPSDPLYNQGDPFMIAYSPTQQLLKNITFNAISLVSIERHYVNIIVKKEAANLTILDGQNVGNQFQAFPSAPDYVYARINISEGVHSLSNTEGFIAYVYGFGNIESYGYAVGASLENLNFKVEPEYDFAVTGEKVACYNKEGQWEIFPENEIFTYFLWDFGDGSPTKEGKKVSHTYTSLGKFEVKVIASQSAASCDEQETVVFEIEVSQVEGEIQGIASVCPQVEELQYFFNADRSFSKVLWEVDGGVISEVNEAEGWVKVIWGESNPNAWLKAIPYTLQGCPSDEVVLPVVINQVIEPSLPEGEGTICFDPTVLWTYKVPISSSGRAYQWFVEGGIFVGDSNLDTVQVQWTLSGGTGKIWYRESSLVDELCAGDSPVLEVAINAVFEAFVGKVNPVKCFGETSGGIVLNVSGGLPPYRYEWSHNPGLGSGVADQLKAGFYTVKVIDAFGCEILLENIEVTEPELLEVLDVETTATSCFGKADGEASIMIRGGTPPYTIDLPGANIQGGTILLAGLEGKDYMLKVTDANGCEIPVIFIVDSPLPLEVDVRIEKTACPGESNGALIALPTGGFGPYTYVWSFDNSSDVVLSDIPKGIYQVNVRDSRGCVSIGQKEMIEEAPKVRLPTGFLPSDGPYGAVSNCQLRFNLTVFNRWGQLVYRGSDGWDGTFNGQEAPIGSYTYIYQYTYMLNGEQIVNETKGLFTLIR